MYSKRILYAGIMILLLILVSSQTFAQPLP